MTGADAGKKGSSSTHMRRAVDPQASGATSVIPQLATWMVSAMGGKGNFAEREGREGRAKAKKQTKGGRMCVVCARPSSCLLAVRSGIRKVRFDNVAMGRCRLRRPGGAQGRETRG